MGKKKDIMDGWLGYVPLKEEFPFGYSQMKFNYIKDHAKHVYEATVAMETMWHNREVLNEDDLTKWLDWKRSDIEKTIEYLKGYLEPKEKE